MQPYMDFNEGFCLYECHNCSKACPTGAISFVSGKQKRQIKIGTAIFKEDLCIVKTDGTDCAACGEHCPVQAIEMIPFGDKKDSLYIPHIHPDVCIGCGACESICPVRPHRAIVVEGLAVHVQAKKFD
jgi:ferredoxin